MSVFFFLFFTMLGCGIIKRKPLVKPTVVLIPLVKFIEDFGFTMP